MHRVRLALRLAVAVGVAATFIPASAQAVGFGYSNAIGSPGYSQQFAICQGSTALPCPSGDLQVSPEYSGTLFSKFSSTVLRASKNDGYVRFNVPYDALYSYNAATGACGPSVFNTGAGEFQPPENGAFDFAQLIYDIQGAQQLGLTPLVVITPGSTGEGVPRYPDPGYGSSSTNLAGWTIGGLDYDCGVYAIVAYERYFLGASAVHQWEAWNEPNTDGVSYNGTAGDCSSSPSTNPCGAIYSSPLCGNTTNMSCGPLEAAELWQLFESVVTSQGWTGQDVAAMTESSAENQPWGNAYVNQLNDLVACSPGYLSATGTCLAWYYPDYWGVHDYHDVDWGGTNDLQWFENMLSAKEFEPPRVWVTESGADLGDGTTTDLNGSVGSCGLGTGFGPCRLQGSSTAQVNAANAWKSGLPAVSAVSVSTTEVYWFQFGATGGFDSALTDATGFDGANNQQSTAGNPRPSFCTLTGYSPCNGSLYFDGTS